MNRIITVGLMAAALSACVSTDDPGSSSSSDISSQVSLSSEQRSSLSSISSSMSSITPPSSSSSSSEPGLVGDALRGKALFLGDLGNNGKCTGCHQDPDGDGYIAGPGPGAVIDPDQLGARSATADYVASGPSDVAQYIRGAMSALAVGGCDEQCSLDIATYIWFTRDGIDGPTPVSNSCELASDDIRYGNRSLKVLTKYEYSNSLQALFNRALPEDYSVEIGADDKEKGFPNNINLNITDSYFERYDAAAKKVAQWAIANPASLNFTCSAASTCAQAFTQTFAAKAFRRPLTAQEVANYTKVITSASTPTVGLEWAMRSVLSAPQFLYRSELGRTVAQALADEPTAAPAPSVTTDTGVLSVGEPSREFDMQGAEYDSAGLATYGSNDFKGANVDASIFTGNDAISITVVGKGIVGLNAKNEKVFEVTVDHSSPTTYTYLLPAGNGNYVQTFTGNGSEGLKISRVKIGAAITGSGSGDVGGDVTPPAELPTAKLERADRNAYVLDAYEYASALSYFLTGGSPDEDLIAAAASGAIFDDSTLEEHVDRMMDSSLGRQQVGRFAGIWFGTDDILDTSKTPREGNAAFTAQVRESMAQEIREIFKESFYSEGDFLDIYRGSYTMLDKTLSDYYGIPGGGSGHMNFQRVDMSNSDRGGVFASGGFMATYAALERTSPVRRSVHFRQEMLCQNIPAPNSLGADNLDRDEKLEAANVIRDSAMGNEGEYFSVLTSPAACDSCHKLIINPLFATDDFDRFGRLHERRNGDVFQTAMSYFIKSLDDNGNEKLDEHGRNIYESKFGEATVSAVAVNQGGYLYGGYGVGDLGSSAIDDAENATGIAFKGAKNLGQLVAEKNLPGLAACLVDRSSRLAFGEPLDERLVGENTFRTDEQKLNFNCVKSDVTQAYETSGNSARAVFKALAMSDALLFRK